MTTSDGNGSKSAKPTFGAMTVGEYTAKINTPAKNPDYFRLFHAPLVERAAASRPGRPIRVLDVACGPAQELDFLNNDARVELMGVDLDSGFFQAAQERLQNAKFFSWDVRAHPPLPTGIPPGSVDVGIALNAVVYVPERMLEALKFGLRAGGECAVNFRCFDNPYNLPFYTHYTERGGVLREETLMLNTARGGKENFKLMALDYQNCDDPAMKNLVIQVYFHSKTDIQRLIDVVGFEIRSCVPFHFASPVNPDNEIDVFVLRKP
jgi:SAM-dependent methyltransferase